MGKNESQQPKPSGDNPDLFDVSEIFRAVWKRKFSFLLPIVLLLGGILAFHTLVAPKYTASARLFIDPIGLDITRKDITPHSRTFSGNSEFVESKMRIVTSDEVLGKVIKSLELGTDKEFGLKKKGLLQKIPVLGPALAKLKSMVLPVKKGAASTETPYERALLKLRSSVKTHKGKNSYVVDVFVKTKSGGKSAKIANAIVNTFLSSQKRMREESAHKTSVSLMKQLELFKKRLTKAEDAVEKYKARHNIVNVRGNLFNERQLTELSRELTRTQTSWVLSEEKFQQYKAMQAKPISLESLQDVTGSRMIGRLRTRLLQVQQRKAELSQTLMPSHPGLMSVDKQLAKVKQVISQEIKRIVQSAKHEFSRLKGAEQALQGKMSSIKKQMVTVNLASVKLRELERDVEVSRLVYKTNMIRAREISEQTQVNSSNSRVISPALSPAKSDRRILPLLLLLGLGGGSVLGVLLAIVRERLSKYISSARELRAISGLPIIKELPYYKRDLLSRLGNLNNSKRLFRKQDGSARPKTLQKLVKKTLHSPEVLSSSQIRDLLYNYRDTEGQQSIFVMSSGQKDEKGTVTLNLALAASMAGDRVLLVDADVSGGTLSRELAKNAKTGLKAVLEGTVPLEDAVIEGYNETLNILPVENDDIISNSVNSRSIKKYILDKAEGYDLVIFDGGVTGINIHAHSFAEVSGDIVFVARESVTPVAQFRNIVQNMRPYMDKVRGTVFYTG